MTIKKILPKEKQLNFGALHALCRMWTIPLFRKSVKGNGRKLAKYMNIKVHCDDVFKS